MKAFEFNSKIMQKAAVVLIIIGLLLALYPYITNIAANYEQKKLHASLTDPNKEIDNDVEIPEKRVFYFNNAILEIPAIELKVVVLKGTSQDVLNKAPGWYEESSLPGEGNTAIAAHRTMHGAWFNKLDQLHEDDLIQLTHEDTIFIYHVKKVFTVKKNDWSVIKPTATPVLTLTTCHPVGSARERLVVRAVLVSHK